MTRTSLGLAFVLLLSAGCGDDDTPAAPAPASAEPASPRPEPAAEPAPRLDPEPTGPHTGDSLLTIDRCVRTAWSYHGCDRAFPVQGRLWVAHECRSSGGAPADIGAALGGDEIDAPTVARELGGTGRAAPTDEDRYRDVVCARWADYRIRGVGGPIEREAGLSTLTEICERGDRVACARVARQRVWDGDLERARPLFQTGCEADPRNSPMGLCRTLRDVFSGGLHRYAITLAEARGDGLSTDTECTAFVIRHTAPQTGLLHTDPDECEARVQCGERILYGNGGSVCPCSLEGDRLRAGESMTTSTDGDPAFTVDTGAGTFRLEDDAQGTFGAFTLVGRPVDAQASP